MILGEEGWPIATAKGMQARQGSTVKQVTLQMYDYSIHMYNIYILYYIYIFIYLFMNHGRFHSLSIKHCDFAELCWFTGG